VQRCCVNWTVATQGSYAGKNERLLPLYRLRSAPVITIVRVLVFNTHCFVTPTVLSHSVLCNPCSRLTVIAYNRCSRLTVIDYNPCSWLTFITYNPCSRLTVIAYNPCSRLKFITYNPFSWLTFIAYNPCSCLTFIAYNPCSLIFIAAFFLLISNFHCCLIPAVFFNIHWL
jgi:hypothetical protein